MNLTPIQIFIITISVFVFVGLLACAIYFGIEISKKNSVSVPSNEVETPLELEQDKKEENKPAISLEDILGSGTTEPETSENPIPIPIPIPIPSGSNEIPNPEPEIPEPEIPIVGVPSTELPEAPVTLPPSTEAPVTLPPVTEEEVPVDSSCIIYFPTITKTAEERIIPFVDLPTNKEYTISFDLLLTRKLYVYPDDPTHMLVNAGPNFKIYLSNLAPRLEIGLISGEKHVLTPYKPGTVSPIFINTGSTGILNPPVPKTFNFNIQFRKGIRGTTLTEPIKPHVIFKVTNESGTVYESRFETETGFVPIQSYVSPVLFGEGIPLNKKESYPKRYSIDGFCIDM